MPIDRLKLGRVEIEENDDYNRLDHYYGFSHIEGYVPNQVSSRYSLGLNFGRLQILYLHI